MSDPAEIYSHAIAALNRADWKQAQVLASRLLPLVPQHAGAHFVAGVAALRLQQTDLSIAYLQRAVALNPARADYPAELARAFSSARLMKEALEAADRSFALSPSDALVLDTLGVVYGRANAHERAKEVFRRAASLMPETASYRFHLATSLTFAGDIEEAERQYEECLRLDRGYWKAYLALSQLRTQSTEGNHVERLKSMLGQIQGNDEADLYLNLALAKEYEDMQQYPESFAYLAKGKRSGGRGRNYSTANDERLFAALMQPLPDGAGPAGFDTEEPIFVFGMPRSGTTLVERILSSHSQVHSAGELQNFSVALKRASGSATASLFDLDTLARLDKVDWAELGRAYLSSTRPGTGVAAHFVDKLPHNFLYAGFIARALPRSKLVCLRRNPMDTCLSNFRQLFALSSPYYDYSFDLLDTGRYFLLFDRLMAHWEQTMPGRILWVDYESLVEDQKTNTERLLGFCGLGWEEACMEFEKNQAPVATASAVQVRKPLYRSAIQRWKRYEPQMQELRRLLEAAGMTVS